MSDQILKFRESEFREMIGDAVQDSMTIGRAQGMDLARNIVQRCQDEAKGRGWPIDYSPVIEVLNNAFDDLNQEPSGNKSGTHGPKKVGHIDD